jgi:hypothetical protein
MEGDCVCAICRAEIVDDPSDPICMTQCMHKFHLYCIGEVLKRGKHECPYCKMVQPDPVLKQILSDHALLASQDSQASVTLLQDSPAETQAEQPSTHAAVLDKLVVGSTPPKRKKAKTSPCVTLALEDMADKPGPWPAESQTTTPTGGCELAVIPGPSANSASCLGEDLEESQAWGEQPDPVVHLKGGLPTFPVQTVMCYDCGGNTSPNNVRLLSKKAKTWRCKGCRSKITIMYKEFGCWPPKEIQDGDKLLFFFLATAPKRFRFKRQSALLKN